MHWNSRADSRRESVPSSGWGRWLCLCCEDRGSSGDSQCATPARHHALGLWGSSKSQAGGSQGKLHWNSVTKWRWKRKIMFLVLRACFLWSVSLAQLTQSVSAHSWDFTFSKVLYFRDPMFQIVTPTSVPNEGSKTLEISESQLEPQRTISLEASPGGRY